MNPANSPQVKLASLVELFFDSIDQFGRFETLDAEQLPQPSRDLLAHDCHMTVTVEQHHGGPVDVEVLETRIAGDRYSRKILLRRQSDSVVVMFGIVRLDLSVLSEVVKSEIQSQQIPLGRVLINYNVLRSVKRIELFEIRPGEELSRCLADGSPVCHGRTALIFCDGRPAIELLEIVPYAVNSQARERVDSEQS